MSARIAFDAWQMIFPAIGFGIFALIFLVAVFRAVRMSRRSIGRLEQLPFDAETTRPQNHVRIR